MLDSFNPTKAYIVIAIVLIAVTLFFIVIACSDSKERSARNALRNEYKSDAICEETNLWNQQNFMKKCLITGISKKYENEEDIWRICKKLNKKLFCGEK